MRDPDTGTSKGFGFVSYDNFDSSDNSLNAMNGQYFCNRTIHVSYAYKRDTKGERHGSAAERLLAANRPINGRTIGEPLYAPAIPPELLMGAGNQNMFGKPVPMRGNRPVSLPPLPNLPNM